MAMPIAQMEFERVVNLVRAFGWSEDTRRTEGKTLTLILKKVLEGTAVEGAKK